nr:MAG TPA: hypothetical protein [Caudoviricetes sp.]
MIYIHGVQIKIINIILEEKTVIHIISQLKLVVM